MVIKLAMMVYSKIYIFVILANILLTIRCENYFLIDQLRYDFLKLEKELSEAPEIKQEKQELQLLKQFSGFDQKLKQMPEDILKGLEPVKSTKAFLFLHAELKNTENMYTKFRKYQEQKTGESHNKKSTRIIQREDIVREILNPKTGANASINKVYNLILNKEKIATKTKDVVYSIILDKETMAMETKDESFQYKEVFQSPQQIFYNLYNSIALNGLKNYIMLQFAYLSSRKGENGKYAELALIARGSFEKQMNETLSAFQRVMENSLVSVWRYDPEEHKNGATHVELTRFLQGHIENEVDMNAEGTCRNTCETYSSATSRGCTDSNSAYCRAMERCTGKITECRFVEGNMKICPSKIPSRRYDYIEYASGRTFGNKTFCDTQSVKSWLRGFSQCSYCMCLCDEPGPKSDRYFNIRPAMADFKKNRVITGLRFVKHNRIIHLQVQEGKLLPYGYIDKDTVRWVPVDDYKINDPGIYDGKDYFTIKNEERSVVLDDFATNYVVVGVQCIVFERQIRLKIFSSSFDWKNGTLLEKYPGSTYVAAKALDEFEPGKTYIPNNSLPIKLKPNSYVRFTHSDFDTDAAQTTMPFIDIQPVFNEPPVPLNGVGLHLRGQAGYGLFIAPKIFTYNYARLKQWYFPSQNVKIMFDPK